MKQTVVLKPDAYRDVVKIRIYQNLKLEVI